jgi:hypothetical protein
MNANMLVCFLVRPRTAVTSVLGGITVPASTAPPEDLARPRQRLLGTVLNYRFRRPR